MNALHCFNGNVHFPCEFSFLLDNKYSICDQMYDQKELAILLSALGYGHMFFTGNFIININNINIIIIIDSAEMLTNIGTH